MARLTPEQRAAMQKQLEDDAAAAEQEEAEFEYEIGRGDNYARVSSKSKAGRKLNAFFKDSFGIDLDDEPVQDDDEGEPEPKAKPKAQGRQQGGNVTAFGRRVG